MTQSTREVVRHVMIDAAIASDSEPGLDSNIEDPAALPLENRTPRATGRYSYMTKACLICPLG